MRLPLLAFGLAGFVALGADGITTDQIHLARKTSEAWQLNRSGKAPNGQTQSYTVPFRQGTPEEQLEFLVGTANGPYWPNRDAALILLTDSAFIRALPRTLENPENRLALYRLGFRQAGRTPQGFLGAQTGTERPWVSGLGLHLGPKDWRLQAMVSPGFLPEAPRGAGLPAPLLKAPVPSALIHFRALKPGLARLAQVVGGPESQMLQDAASGSRAGFLVRHLQTWLRKSESALGPLEGMEAWVMHYGSGGATLAFIPGDLPTRTDLALGLLRLNPLSSGARVRRVEHTVMWAPNRKRGSFTVDEIRGAGGVLSLMTTAEGTWLADKYSPLEQVVFPNESVPRLFHRQEWGRQALAGAGPADVSFWMLPKAGVGAAQECALIESSARGAAWKPLPGALAKAAPRGGAFGAALGPGPLRAAFEALWTPVHPYSIEDPQVPVFAADAQLSAQQRQDYEKSLREAKQRRERRAELRKVLDQLTPMLEATGAAVHWNGWVAPPPLDPAKRKLLQEYRAKRTWTDAKGETRYGPPPVFGRFEEPGMTPRAALAVPLKTGKGAQAQILLQRLFPLTFKGSVQSKPLGSGKLFRVRTAQAFAPSFAVLGDLLVLGSDEAAVGAVAAGWLGQAPTLADLPPAGWGQAELDGPRIAADLEQLLRAYLGMSGGRRYWWEADEARSADGVADEVALSFGPFLDLLRAQGRLGLVLEPGPGGWTARPR
jgi:hypothetical protein